MSSNKLKAAILIISDTASRDPSTDKAGDALTKTLAAEGDRWASPTIEIVPDDVKLIQRQIRQWTDGDVHGDGFNLVLTCGGTGFAQRDFTPEVSEFWCI